jgi:hypothetical protein
MNVPSDRPSDDHRPNHLASAYSPTWLSGPSHFEGLVAVATEPDDADAAAPDGPRRDTSA